MIGVAVAGAAHPHVEYALREVREVPELTLLAVADHSVEVARRYAEPFAAAVFTDHREMLQAVTPNVVVIAGIYGERGPAIVDSLNAGCHVVADKPLCTTQADLERIRTASRASGKSVTLLLEKRYYPETIAALETVESGALGTVVEVMSTGPHKLNAASRPQWFWDRSAYGGILADLVTHDLDLGMLFTGASAGTIRGNVTGAPTDHPDFSLGGVAVVHSPGGLMVLEANWLTPAMSPVHGEYHMRLAGTRGVAELWWAGHRVSITTDRRGPYDLELGPGYRPAEPVFRSLVRGEVPALAGQDSFLATELALAAQRSAEEGGAAISWSR